jgi:hypothetical protein
MGSWSVNCGISNIAITSGDDCVILPLKENKSGEYRKFQPATLPIFGKYNDYGNMEEIIEDDNTKLIEEHFGITIDEFVTFLVDGKFTYNRGEAEDVKVKIKNYEEAAEWRFMWIDRKVYETMLNDVDEWHKGYSNYGTPEMLKLLGFEKISESQSFDNYDPKRFNQLWINKDGVEFFSDGSTLLSTGQHGKTKNTYVYHFGHGDETSIETYFKVPKELEYLKTINKSRTWRLMNASDLTQEFGWIMGSRYEFDRFTMRHENLMIDIMQKILKKNQDELTENDKQELEELKLEIKEGKFKELQNQKLHRKYYSNFNQWGDRIVDLMQLVMNLHPMSHELLPHTLYLTPQCGEHEQHQFFLNRFAEINYAKMIERDFDPKTLCKIKRYSEDDVKAIVNSINGGKNLGEALLERVQIENKSL